MRPFRAVFVNRQGAAPLMAGGAVIFLPRDVGGAFALSRETGKLLWQEPLLPADELIGRQGTVVFLRNQHSVAAVDAATGKALWERYFPEPIARSALLGGSLLVDDGKDLVHLSCKDGTAAPQPQPWKEPVLTFAPRGGGLLAVSPSAVNHDVGQPINPQAQDQPLALPLAQAWFLPRPAATIVVPPPEAQMPDRVLLVSQNLIECLTPTAKGAITWRLLVEGGFKLAWADKKLLVIHPGKVLAVGIDGKTLWQARTPFTIGRHLVAGPHLILQTNGNPWEYLGRATAAIDLTNGQVLWQSHFRQDLTYPEWSYPARGLGFDGQNLHMVGYFEPWKNCDVVVRPADGKILEIVPVPPMSAGGVAFQGTWGLIADDARRLTEIDITRKSPPKPFGADLRQVLQPGNYYMRLDHAVKMADPWALLRFDDLYYHKEDRSTVIKRGDPSYQMTIMALGDLFGDLLVASNPAGAAIVHLPTKKQIQFNMPLGPEHVGRPEKALGAWEMGSRLMLVSGMIREGRGGWPVHVRVDMLDRETGAPQGCQILDDVLMGQLLSPSTGYAVENQAVRVGQTLLVTDVAGLHAFVGSPQAPLSSLLPLPATMCLPQSIRLDGLLDDWPDTPPLAIKDRLGRPGQLQIACDGAFIYLAISYHCGQLEPREGRGAFGAGAMLEMNLQAGPLSYKANLSIDHRGKRVVENLQVEQAVDVQYGHYYDAAAGEIVFEAAVPAQALGWRAARTGIGPLQVGFTAWDGSTAIGAEPLFTVRAQMPEIEPAKAAPPKPPRRTPRRP